MEDEFVIISDEVTSLPPLAEPDAPRQLDRFKRFLENITKDVDRLNIADWERGMVPLSTPADEFVRAKAFIRNVKNQIREFESKKNN